MTEHTKAVLERRKRWFTVILAGLALMILGASLAVNLNFFAEKRLAQGEAQTASEQTQALAEELADACKSGKVVRSISGNNLCDKAENLAQTPASTEGPQGAQGPRGLPGADGADGAVGKTGATGPAGKTGPKGDTGDPGIPGVPGVLGQMGPAGADGVPGPAGPVGPVGPIGPAGPAGPAGAKGDPGDDGSSIDSFTFTDQDGRTYYCVPNPPGSSAFSCTSADAPVPTVAPAP